MILCCLEECNPVRKIKGGNLSSNILAVEDDEMLVQLLDHTCAISQSLTVGREVF
jgi:hypothetical protein